MQTLEIKLVQRGFSQKNLLLAKEERKCVRAGNEKMDRLTSCRLRLSDTLAERLRQVHCVLAANYTTATDAD